MARRIIGVVLVTIVVAAFVAATCIGCFGQVVSSDITLKTQTGDLAGTLLVPAGNGPFPVVLIIAGSGRTDRNGNTVGMSERSDALKLLAEGLVKKGFASVRYDKRSVAASEKARLPTNKFETQVDDAAAWLSKLGSDKRFTSVGAIGHSEGAIIGTIAAERGVATAFVSLSGGGRPFDEVCMWQIEASVKAGEMSKKNADAMRSVFAELKAGRTVEKRPDNIPDLFWKGMFVPRGQEYLISIFQYDPAVEIAKLNDKGVKIMLIGGSTDLSGGPEESIRLANAAHTKPVTIAGMNHELKDAPLNRTANNAASSDPNRPLSAGLIDEITSFLTASIAKPKD